MTIDNTTDALGRLPIAADDEDACGTEHYWSGWECQAVPDHDGPHRYYLNGAHATWTQAQGVVVVHRGDR